MYRPIPIYESTHIQQAKVFDDEIFSGHQQITLYELESIAKQNGLYAIFNNNEIIGEAQILFNTTDFFTLENSEWAFIYGLGVSPEYRNTGMGAQLLSFLENLSRQKQKTVIYLATRPKNNNAIKLWKKAGYQEFDYKPNFFGINEAKDGRLLFKKHLK